MFQTIIKALGLVKDFADAKEWLGKRWFLSKTIWVNAIALIALILQNKFGYVLSTDEQIAILAVINMIIRFLTKQPLVLREEDITHIEERPDG
ncbi:MAG: hypothetical protein N2738_06945 [Thermodesulfovibrionales bacterium]|nr:hypothetical protein [Thermodesulfovibrionales bacterium]